MNRPFDKAKYKTLLEGLEVSIISKQQLLTDNIDFRLDAEYQKKEFIKLNKHLKKYGYKKVDEFAYVTDGIHTSIDYTDMAEVNLISATSPKENYFDLSRSVFINPKTHLENPRTALKENDVIISTVGTIGNCAVVTKSILPANSDRHVGIIRINNSFSPFFLSTYLLTKYGRFQTLRESTGNVQLNLFIYKIRSLKVATITPYFQSIIESKVKRANEKLDECKKIYKNAENYLLKILGLENWSPSIENKSIKKLSDSFFKSGRIDAEYYQPKYDEINNIVSNYGYINLKSIVRKVTSGFPYESSRYSEKEGVNLIRINNLTPYGLDLTNAIKIPQSDTLLSPKDKVNKGDILISMSGTVGLSCHVREDIDAYVNQRILKFTPNNFDGDVLALVINSIVGKMQLERVGTGGVQTNLSNSDILNINIPLLSMKIQKELSKEIQNSLNLRKESERLLEISKRAVEIAIEQDEVTAIKYIEENT